VLLRGRVQHQEPEKGAEAHREDGRVHRQLHPRHAHRGGADQEDRRGRQRQVEAAVEEVGGAGERIDAVQPGGDPDALAERIERERRGEREPGAAQIAAWRIARRHPADDDRSEGSRQCPGEPDVVRDGRAEQAREHEEGADGTVDHESGEQPADPTR